MFWGRRALGFPADGGFAAHKCDVRGQPQVAPRSVTFPLRQAPGASFLFCGGFHGAAHAAPVLRAIWQAARRELFTEKQAGVAYGRQSPSSPMW